MPRIPKLRAYQAKHVKRVIKALRVGQNVILQSPVGTGKTAMGHAIAAKFEKAGGRVLWLAHSRELRDQSDHDNAQTIQSAYRYDHGDLALIVIDECHRTVNQSVDGMYAQLLSRHPGVPVLGLTATPLRADGVSLMRDKGGVYDVLDLGLSIAEHVQAGTILAPKHYTSPEPIDLKGLKLAGKDYDMGAAAERLNTKQLCGNVVNHYQVHGKDRQAVVFACNVQHAEALTNRFNAAKIRARMVFGAQPNHIREANFADFKAGKFSVLVNVMLATEGWDYPELGVAIIARPTKSRTLYLQMVGRVMRSLPGKSRPVLLDHGGVFHVHGLVTDEFDWTTGRHNRPRTAECPACGQIHEFPLPEFCDCGHKLIAAELEAAGRVRKSSTEESADALVLAEEAAKRAAERAAAKHLSKQRDWVPLRGRGIPSELVQREMLLKFLSSPRRGPKGYGLRGLALDYNLSVPAAKAIVVMKARKHLRESNVYERKFHFRDLRDRSPGALTGIWQKHPERRHEFTEEMREKVRNYRRHHRANKKKKETSNDSN